MGNILFIGVGLFTVGMVAVGLKRGLIKMAFSVVSVFVVLLLVNILTPSVKELVKTTTVYETINQNIQTYVDEHVERATENMTQTGVNAQKKIIEGLPLPNGVIDNLVKNNNQENYAKMQVESFSAYIAESLSDMVLSALTFVVLFVVISILIKILVIVLDIVSKLPVISTFNTAGGALLGLAEAILIIWIACIVVTAFSTTEWGQEICKAIAENGALSFLYDHNLIQSFLTGFFVSI